MWKQIGNLNYEISEEGEVRNAKTKKHLKPQPSWNGYLAICLYYGSRNKREKFMVHRLVASAFIPNPENKPQVNHKDCCKTNNSRENLEWVTIQENIDHAVDNNRMIAFKNEEHPMCRVSNSDVLAIRGSTLSTKELAKVYSLSIRQIQRIKVGSGRKLGEG